jgi:hypothetical protein
MMDVTTQLAPIRSGNSISVVAASPAKKIARAPSLQRRHRVGFEQVGSHAGAVADVVAHVVGDGGRVARIVFGNASFDLADEVAADVRTLGEDTAAETGKDGDQRCAEAERHERINNCAVSSRHTPSGLSGCSSRRQRPAGEAGHQHAGDAPDLKAMSRPPARLLDAACAVRTLARTETCMPMIAGGTDKTAPIRKPMAAGPRQEQPG